MEFQKFKRVILEFQKFKRVILSLHKSVGVQEETAPLLLSRPKKTKNGFLYVYIWFDPWVILIFCSFGESNCFSLNILIFLSFLWFTLLNMPLVQIWYFTLVMCSYFISIIHESFIYYFKIILREISCFL